MPAMGLIGRSVLSVVLDDDSTTLEDHDNNTGGDGSDGGGGGGGGKDLQNWSSLIGIVTAIVGNVLIALALNVQRYAHIRLHRERSQRKKRAKEALQRVQNGNGNGTGTYGTVDRSEQQQQQQQQTSNFDGTGHTNGGRDNNNNNNHNSGGDEHNPGESEPLMRRSFQSEHSNNSNSSADDDEYTPSYLRSPYWWMGQILITLGELGNFLAYGFAPASIVSPLGVVALISNCIIAPILFKEAFRQRDFWGVVIAVGGVVTVVLSANTQESKLDPDGVLDHITTIEFEVYMAVTIALIAVLMWASPRYGHKTILIDLGLVGLFGGYTALATKGVSSMLSSTLLRAFTTPVTYVLVFILLFTAVMQVRYVNRALQRFDSTQVIPIQFVTFTLCVIIGSAVLYRDFERTDRQQAAKFVGGCFLTFFGVFLITSGRSRSHDDEDDDLSDDQDVEETIGLHAQVANNDQTRPQPKPHQTLDPRSSSRRSSKASRLSLLPSDPQLFSRSHDSGGPSMRRPSTQPGGSYGDHDVQPLLENPWNGPGDEVDLPHGVHAVSNESVPTLSVRGEAPSEPTTPMRDGQGSSVYPEQGLLTPRAALSLPAQAQRPSTRPSPQQFSGPLFSPSPLSSTVSAVVKDTLLRNADSPLLRRRSVRRLRSSIRASLFMSEDELRAQQATEEEAWRRRQASRSQDRLDYFTSPTEYTEEEARADSSQLDGTVRPRSLSDTLGELFKTNSNSRKSDPESGDRGP